MTSCYCVVRHWQRVAMCLLRACTLVISFQKFSAVTMTTSPPSTCSICTIFLLWSEYKVLPWCADGPFEETKATYRLLHYNPKCGIAELLSIQPAEDTCLSYKRSQSTRAKRQELRYILSPLAKINTALNKAPSAA